MLKRLIRGLGRIARNLTSWAVTGLAFFGTFFCVVLPALILSGIITTLAVTYALVLDSDDHVTTFLTNFAKDVYDEIMDTNHNLDARGYSLNSASNKARFILDASFASVAVALGASVYVAIVVTDKLEAAITTALDFIASPINWLLGPDDAAPTTTPPATPVVEGFIDDKNLDTALTRSKAVPQQTSPWSFFSLDLSRSTQTPLPGQNAASIPTFTPSGSSAKLT